MSDTGKPYETGPQPPREDADIGSSSEDYARRFIGGVGRWFVATQTRITLGLLQAMPAGASILDVAGGHGQIAPPLIQAGYDLTVVGSDPACAVRLEPWITQGRCRFQAVNLLALPFADRSFDAVVCLRLLPHSVDWSALIKELCRVARRSVILDYPSSRSVNVLSSRFFHLKRRIELNTRRYHTFSPRQIRSAFLENGFSVSEERAQFLLPMVLHRFTNRAALSKVAETPGRLLGLTRRFGSPKIIRADRRGSSA